MVNDIDKTLNKLIMRMTVSMCPMNHARARTACDKKARENAFPSRACTICAGQTRESTRRQRARVLIHIDHTSTLSRTHTYLRGAHAHTHIHTHIHVHRHRQSDTLIHGPVHIHRCRAHTLAKAFASIFFFYHKLCSLIRLLTRL